jgi:hypothetical protein
MRRYTLSLRPLAPSEISRIELLLAHKTSLRTSASTRAFLSEVTKTLKYDEPRLQKNQLRVGDRREIANARARWLLKIRGPAFGRDLTPSWSIINLNVKAEVRQGAKNAALWLDFSLADQYFNWLLVRALANDQLPNFVECTFCGDVKHAGIARRNVRFCCTDHRVRFHYYVSRRGAKDLLKERRALRAKGIPCSVQDILYLRSSGVQHGSRKAQKLLLGSSLPIAGLDQAERDALRKHYKIDTRVAN